jgi:hypothetical protein
MYLVGFFSVNCILYAQWFDILLGEVTFRFLGDSKDHRNVDEASILIKPHKCLGNFQLFWIPTNIMKPTKCAEISKMLRNITIFERIQMFWKITYVFSPTHLLI